MFDTFQYRGFIKLELYCTLTTEALLRLNMHFDCRYLELLNACAISLVFFIVLNAVDRNEFKYHSIVFLSIHYIS